MKNTLIPIAKQQYEPQLLSAGKDIFQIIIELKFITMLHSNLTILHLALLETEMC